MGDIMKEASFSLTEAYFAAGDFRFDPISKDSKIKLRTIFNDAFINIAITD